MSDLIATYTEEASKTINLAWSAPDMNAIFNDDMTEDFEKGRTWTNENLDGWTFVDNDNYGIYGFNLFEVPDYAPQPLSQQSWWIIDDLYEPLSQHFSDPRFYKAHSVTNILYQWPLPTTNTLRNAAMTEQYHPASTVRRRPFRSGPARCSPMHLKAWRFSTQPKEQI